MLYLINYILYPISNIKISAFEEKDNIFTMISRNELETYATELLSELFEENEDSEVELHETDEIVSTASTFADNLQQKIDAKLTPKTSEIPIKKSLKTEMALFEATGGKQMGEYLKMLKDALKNIAPTSIACEQAFSIATDLIPKKRSGLSDQAIDDLIFEKGFFENEGFSYK